MGRALLISFSGIESSGKSTQIARLMERAQAAGERPVKLWTRPGYTPTLEAGKRRLRRLRGRRSPEAGSGERASRAYPRRAEGFRSSFTRRLWLSLALLDLLWWYAVRVRLWRASGRTVVCDRYLADCRVDFRVNFPEDDVESGLLARLLTALAPRPDLALVLLLPLEDSLERSVGRERRFRENKEVLAQRHAAYESLAGERGVVALDGRSPERDLEREIERLVDAAGCSAGDRA